MRARRRSGRAACPLVLAQAQALAQALGSRLRLALERGCLKGLARRPKPQRPRADGSNPDAGCPDPDSPTPNMPPRTTSSLETAPAPAASGPQWVWEGSSSGEWRTGHSAPLGRCPRYNAPGTRPNRNPQPAGPGRKRAGRLPHCAARWRMSLPKHFSPTAPVVRGLRANVTRRRSPVAVCERSSRPGIKPRALPEALFPHTHGMVFVPPITPIHLPPGALSRPS